MQAFPRPCLDCSQLTRNGSRCEHCEQIVKQRINAARAPRYHYGGDYARRAKAVRDTAEQCWICGDGARPDDPWQADHLYPADPSSPLAAAHRSCNVKRGNKSITETLRG